MTTFECISPTYASRRSSFPLSFTQVWILLYTLSLVCPIRVLPSWDEFKRPTNLTILQPLGDYPSAGGELSHCIYSDEFAISRFRGYTYEFSSVPLAAAIDARNGLRMKVYGNTEGNIRRNPQDNICHVSLWMSYGCEWN